MYRVYRAAVQNQADESCNVTIIKYNYICDSFVSLSVTFYFIVIYQENIFPTMYTQTSRVYVYRFHR